MTIEARESESYAFKSIVSDNSTTTKAQFKRSLKSLIEAGTMKKNKRPKNEKQRRKMLEGLKYIKDHHLLKPTQIIERNLWGKCSKN